jgi:hypothetical protein
MSCAPLSGKIPGLIATTSADLDLMFRMLVGARCQGFHLARDIQDADAGPRIRSETWMESNDLPTSGFAVPAPWGQDYRLLRLKAGVASPPKQHGALISASTERKRHAPTWFGDNEISSQNAAGVLFSAAAIPLSS